MIVERLLCLNFRCSSIIQWRVYCFIHWYISFSSFTLKNNSFVPWKIWSNGWILFPHIILTNLCYILLGGILLLSCRMGLSECGFNKFDVFLFYSVIPLLRESVGILMQRTPPLLENTLPQCYQRVSFKASKPLGFGCFQAVRGYNFYKYG